MRITSIAMKDFRNFKNSRFEFKPGINILYGDAGSGKSNLLHALIIAMNGSNVIFPGMPHIRFAPTDARFEYHKKDQTYVKDIFWPEITCNAFLDKEYEWTMFKFNHTASTMTENKPNPKFEDEQPIFNYFYSNIENGDVCEYRKVLALLNKFMNEFEKCSIICDDYQVEVVYKTEDNICGARYLDAGRRKLMNLFVHIAMQMIINNYFNQEFNKVSGVVLIDDVEVFLHANFQWKILDALHKYFPNVQFIVTTHSPIILVSTHANCINMNGGCDDFYGLTLNEVSRFMSSRYLPERVMNNFSSFDSYLDNQQFDEAQELLDQMREEMHSSSTEIVAIDVALSLEREDIK